MPWLEDGGEKSTKCFLDYVEDEVKHDTYLKAKDFVEKSNVVKKFLVDEGIKRRVDRIQPAPTQFEKKLKRKKMDDEKEMEEKIWNEEITTIGGAKGKVEVMWIIICYTTWTSVHRFDVHKMYCS